MNDADALAAGLLAGHAHGCELKKLSALTMIDKLGGEEAVAKTVGEKALGILRQYGNAAVNAGVGATVGTIVGKSMSNQGAQRKNHADLQLATAAPGIFRAGYEEGLRRAIENRAGGGAK